VNVTEGTLLDGRVRYRQFAHGHRSGFEPVLLAAAVPARPGERVLDAGTGAGAALLCLGHRVPGLTGIGLELDPDLAALAQENLKINDLDGFPAVVGDATAPPPMPPFDHIMANPPWHDPAATPSPDSARALAHHAVPNLLTAWIAGLSRRLKPRGTITLILPAAAFSEAAAGLRAQNHGAITLFPLWPRAGQPAKQFIIAARQGVKTPDKILAGLILHDEGGITPEANQILRHGRALTL
jgi:tRNA1(Val) A37 N6-methylase TrmN6